MPSGPLGDLWDALAAPVRTGRRLLPCALLRRILTGRKVPKPGRETLDQALLLGASLHGLVQAMLADGTDWTIPSRQRWGSKWLHRPLLVTAKQFEFAPAPIRQETRPAFEQYRFLASLPEGWAAQLCRWAPPVVSRPSTLEDGVPVLENLLPAYLAMHSVPLEGVWCRVLERPSRPRFSAQDLAAFAFPHLEDFVMAHRERIAVAAPSLMQAVVLTGWSRAKVARIRQQAGSAT